MDYILAIDQGTSSTRAIIYTAQGQWVVSSQYPITQLYPQSGWVEHDPEEIWQKTLTAIRDVIAAVKPHKIVACGLTNQRETTVMWDKLTGKCLAPAIVWQDRRTDEWCRSFSAHTAKIQAKTGLFPDAYFSASKIHWLLNHVPQISELLTQDRVAFGTIDSFLISRLTGGTEHLTDVTNASRTLLFNIHTEQWDDDLLQLLGIPKNILPTVKSSDAHFGNIEKKLLGLSIPITGVVGDQQAALIGQSCFTKGMIKATYGTGGFLLLNTGNQPVQSQHQLLTTIAYRIQEKTVYGLEGSIYQAGTIIKWLRDELHLIDTASETETLAQTLESNEGVYLIPSFTGLGAPHWLSTSGAAIIGLSRTSNRAHFARAALESVCYQTHDILTCMRQDSGIPLPLLRVDGGMAANSWFLQFLAATCDVTVQRPPIIETTSLGAAMLAAIGSGLIDSLETLAQQWICEQQFTNETHTGEIAGYYQGWQRALTMVKAGM